MGTFKQPLRTYHPIIILRTGKLISKQNACPSEYFFIFCGGAANKA
jgi:hypothetical protein